MESHEKTETPRYQERASNIFQPMSRSITPQNANAHDLYTRGHVHLTRGSPRPKRQEDPHFGSRDCPHFGIGDPRSESQFSPFSGKTNSLFTINTDLPSGIHLAEIIVIKAFIQIIQRIDLSIRVEAADSLSKYLYRAHYFAGKDHSNFLEACVTKPETVLPIDRK